MKVQDFVFNMSIGPQLKGLGFLVEAFCEATRIKHTHTQPKP